MKSHDPRPTVLVPTRYFYPAYKAGGVARSLTNLVEALSEHYRFVVFCSNTDIDGMPHHQAGEQVNCFGAEVHYTQPRTLQGLRHWRRLQRQPHQLLYLNSYFDPWFSLMPTLLRTSRSTPLLIAPRGEFSPSALQIKATKKHLALSAAGAMRIQAHATWQASTVHESSDIERVHKRYGIHATSPHLAIDIARPPRHIDVSPSTKPAHPLRLVMVARIAPIKNLSFALQVLHQAGVPVALDLIGPIEDPHYWADCQRQIEQLPATVAVSHLGSVPPEQVEALLPNYDLLFLPSQSENFGHAVHEALAASVPVLISDQTPWKNLQKDGAGWDLPLVVDAFADVLRQFAKMSPTERQRLRAGASRAAASSVRDDAIEAHRKMLSEVIFQGSRK